MNIRTTSLFLLIASCWVARGASEVASVSDPGEIPPLHPPLQEVAPGTWELYGTSILLGSAALLIIVGASARWLLRPKVIPPVPPEILVRETLSRMSGQQGPEMVTVVSRALRAYLASVFNLPTVELTTAEFVRTLTSSKQPGPELAEAASEFLRHCDKRKFAPPENDGGWDAATKALGLVDLVEKRRAALQAPRENA